MNINEQTQINKKITVNHHFICKNNHNKMKNRVNLGGIKRNYKELIYLMIYKKRILQELKY